MREYAREGGTLTCMIKMTLYNFFNINPFWGLRRETWQMSEQITSKIFLLTDKANIIKDLD